MALKRKVSKAEYDALNDVLKAEYKQNGDNFFLDTDDATELSNALASEKAAHTATKEKLTTATTDLQTITNKNGDVNALVESYKGKVAKLEGELATANTTISTQRHEFIAGSVAKELAIKNFKAPGLIEPIIAKRLAVDPKDGTTLIVLDAAGKPSAATKEDLLKELVDNKDYADIVIANRATGSAGHGGNAPNSNSPFVPPVDPKTNAPKDFADYSPQELKDHMAAKHAAATP